MKQEHLKCLFTTLIFILVFNFDIIAQWQKIPTPWGGYIQCFTEKDNIIYAGTAENGLFYSTDNGIQWYKFINSPGLNIKSLAVDAEWMYAISENGLYKSKDNGISWKSIQTGSKIWDVKSQGGIINLVDDYGIYTSTNNGSTWTFNNYTKGAQSFSSGDNSLIAHTWSSNVFIFNAQDKTWGNKYLPYYVETSSSTVYNDKIYVGTWGYGVYVSSNGGDSWEQIKSPLISDGYISHIAVYGNTIYVCSDAVGIFSSSDEGATWNYLKNGLDNLNFTKMYFSTSKIFLGTYSGIYASSDNGLNWNSSDKGINAISIKTFAENNGTYYLGTNYGLLTSTNNGQTWKVQSSTLFYKPIISLFADNNNIFIGTKNGVYYSSNNGMSWVSRGLNGSNYIIYDFAKNGADIFIGTNGGVYLTSNLGLSWARMTSENSDFSFTLMINNGILYSGSWGYGLIISENGGKTWTECINLTKQIGNASVKILKHIENVIFASVVGEEANGLFVSYNNGTDWTKKNIRPLSMTECNNMLFIGTKDGILKTTDGENFVKMDSLTTGIIGMLHSSNGVVYACVNSFDLWKNNTINSLKSIDNNKFIFYPNPANKEIVLKFNDFNTFNIKIIDMKGKVLTNTQSNSFNNKIDVSYLNNGIYIVKIADISGNISTSKLNIQHF